MIPSYGGSILEIDLSRKTVERRSTPESLCKEYIGGKGFGTKMLYERVGGDVDPLSPDNILVISVGPTAGTKIPSASKANFNFKSPLTGGYAESHIGGYIAPKLKWAGYDMIIIKGKSEKPAYIQIDENGAEIRDASHLWGKTTYETEEILKKETDKNAATLEIGPAGENLVRFACVCHAEGWRQAGRAGTGAVMGSKNLKAIVVISDQKEVEVADSDALDSFVKEVLDNIKRDPVGTLAENYRKYGTPLMVERSNLMKFFPTRYWHLVYFERFEKIGPKEMAKYVVSNRACWNCPLACGKLVEIKDGKYAGTRVEGPEYETLFAFGGLCEIDDLPAIAKLNDLCDMYGLDTITMGNVAGFAIEAYKLGKLKSERPLEYSDPESVIWLVEQVAFRKGVGDLLAEGVKRASEKLNAQELAVETKGLEPPGYDPRSLQGMALGYALSDRGACHLRALMFTVDLSGEIERYGIPLEKVPRYLDNEDRFNIFDCLMLCRFARRIYDWDRLARMIKALTGIDYGVDGLKTVSQRVQTLSRLFNLRCGFKAEDDTLPKRFFEEEVEVEGGRKVVVRQQELESAVKEYYRLRGWDEKGVPLEQTLKKLGITS